MKPLIENERVRVWDMVWTRGRPGPIQKYDLDTVQVFLAGGGIRIKNADGAPKVVKRKAGEAVFVPKGAAFAEEGAGETPAHSVIIEFKDHPVEPLKNTTGLPNAFPRPHVKKVMDNKRFTVWDYEWYPDQPTPMHFHDKDVVVSYFDEGSLKSTTPDGQVTVNDYHPGDIRFNRGNRSHNELLVKGTQRALMVELK